MPLGKEGNVIPKGNLKNKIGNAVLEKGAWQYGNKEEENFYLIAWDFATDCTGKDCPLYSKCHYTKQWEVNKTNKCRMQLRYMKNVIFAFVDKMRKAKKSDQEDIIKLGYHLLPLYAQLFKFKVWEHGNSELVIHSSRGDPRVHPVYKEIREIIKTITNVWRDIGDKVGKQDDPGKIGDGAFIDALYTVEDGEVKDDKGSGLDFDEEQSEVNDKGEGLDIDVYNTAALPKKVDNKPKKKKKKRKRVKKEKPKVESYLKRHRNKNDE